MSKLYTPTFGPSDWRRFLANPEGQWRNTKSAFELAVAWESSRKSVRGLPPEVAALFDGHSEFKGATLLLGIPEHQVTLAGGGHASQTDLWALVSAPLGIISVAVEAKAGEKFDKRVPEWLADASPRSGKPARLQQLCEVLGINEAQARECRYQLLHRPVAAIFEAKRFQLSTALFLVHSFTSDPESLSDYVCFGRQLGFEVGENSLVNVGPRDGIDLWLGWISTPPADCATITAAV